MPNVAQRTHSAKWHFRNDWSKMSIYSTYSTVCLKPDTVTAAYNPESEFAYLLYVFGMYINFIQHFGYIRIKTCSFNLPVCLGLASKWHSRRTFSREKRPGHWPKVSILSMRDCLQDVVEPGLSCTVLLQYFTPHNPIRVCTLSNSYFII